MADTRPLYLRIQQHLTEMIHSGNLGESDKLPSEKEISEQFSVSRITVRKALSTMEEAGLIHRIPGRGTFVSSGEEDLSPADEPCKRIGLIMSSLDSPFLVTLLQAIEDAAGANGFQLMFALSRGDVATEKMHIGKMLQNQVQGIILYPVDGLYYNEQILQLSIENYPIVLLDRFMPGINTSSVCFDNKEGGRQIGEYLVGKGHRNIAILTPRPEMTISLQDRIEGYKDALMQAGMVYTANRGLFTIEPSAVGEDREGYDGNMVMIRELLENEPDITALYCTKSCIAVNAFKATKECHRKVEIVCFDPITPYEWTEDLPISCISYSEREMGEQAVGQIAALIGGGKPENIVLPVCLNSVKGL